MSSGAGERERQELRPAGGHLLVEGCEPGRGAGVAAHQGDDVDEAGLAEVCHGPAVGLRAEAAGAEDLAASLDDAGLPVAEPVERLAVPHNVDDGGVEADRHRLQLVQRPLERRVVLARRGQDGELQERTSGRRVPADVSARPGAPDCVGGGGWAAGRVGRGDGKAVPGLRVDVRRERRLGLRTGRAERRRRPRRDECHRQTVDSCAHQHHQSPAVSRRPA